MPEIETCFDNSFPARAKMYYHQQQVKEKIINSYRIQEAHTSFNSYQI